MENKYSEEWRRKYNENIEASERYWKANPKEREKSIALWDRLGWAQGRDLGLPPLKDWWKKHTPHYSKKQVWDIAIKNFQERNERHPESWFQKRLKEKRIYSINKNIHPDRNHTQNRDLFSDF